MDLPTKLERLAGSLSVWDNGYDQFTADVRELLEQAAKTIRADRAWIQILTAQRTNRFLDDMMLS